MTDDVADGRDDRVRRAFDRLRSDADAVDTLAALRALDAEQPVGVGRRVLAGTVLALVAVVALGVGALIWAGGDDGEHTTAGEDGAGPVDDERELDGVAGVQGVTWLLLRGTGPDGGELPLVQTAPVTLELGIDQLQGRSACNWYGGSADLHDGAITIGELAMTAMGCEPDVMATEVAFHAALVEVSELALDDGRLVLRGPVVVLEFEPLPAVEWVGAPPPAELPVPLWELVTLLTGEVVTPVPPAELVGQLWELDALMMGEVVSSVVGERALLLFRDDGTFEGSTGCRTFSGEYVLTSSEVLFTQFELEGECPTEMAVQDGHVVGVLGDGFIGGIVGDRLTLHSGAQGPGNGLAYGAARD